MFLIFLSYSYSEYWILQHIKKIIKILGKLILNSYQEKLKKNELHWIMNFFNVIINKNSKLFQFQSKNDSLVKWSSINSYEKKIWKNWK